MQDNLPAIERALGGWRTAGSAARAAALLAAMEDAAFSASLARIDSSLARDVLAETSRIDFISCLSPEDAAGRWAEAVFRWLQVGRFSLLDLFRARAEAHPGKILFQDMSAPLPPQWSYEQIGRMTRVMAAALHALAPGGGAVGGGEAPRVAVFADNRIEGACADLACLFYDILDTPLNTHFSRENLLDIFDRLKINVVLTDTRERRRLLESLRGKTAAPFTIVSLVPEPPSDRSGAPFLGELCLTLGEADIERHLAARRRFEPGEVATVMFTSGSTGRPKGVSFSIYNIVAKRFARGAALPGVGRDEVFLSYLPLFHTFGRYLEMLGAIYWGGTYVFAGNPSADTLFSLFPKVQPTAFISVPIRWAQLHERCLERADAEGPAGSEERALRSVVGRRLRWGLSAAGYLDARVFRFFERHGIEAGSGFGMTEGTGGITMTPPGRYEDNSQGLPLPGMRVRLGPGGELQISGHYVARYLEDKGPGDIIPFPQSPETDYWLSTGDVFQVLPNGYYRIVDRIKDINKNTRGETVAPLKVENKFAGVPGIKRTFLVGDGRPFNVLFIVPDRTDAVLSAGLAGDNERAYYRRLATAANADLAPPERVINFAVLDRDFEAGRGEITPKGSINRKAVEANFAREIEGLYGKSAVELAGGGVRVRLPLWLFRDLGILEDEITFDGARLRDAGRGLELRLSRDPVSGRFAVGDLEYHVRGNVVDLGLFARQPRLWLGNPALIRFCPCREGWDAPLDGVSDEIFLPARRERGPEGAGAPPDAPGPLRIGDRRLAALNDLLAAALFADAGRAASALEEIERLFAEPDLRTVPAIRRRLQALSGHPEEKIRCAAYRILLLDEPNPEYAAALRAFLHSGQTFLNRESIEAIASSPFGQGRFDALRRRMAAYREQLAWPAGEVTRTQFLRIFDLFVDFAGYHPDFFKSVRAELAAWALLPSDHVLSEAAAVRFEELERKRELSAAAVADGRHAPAGAWSARAVFDPDVTGSEKARLAAVLDDPTFLEESLRLVFEADPIRPDEVEPDGIWISRLPPFDARSSFRVVVNVRPGRRYDLRVVLMDAPEAAEWRETLYWHLAIAHSPTGRKILPDIGCIRPALGAMSLWNADELDIWDRMRKVGDIRGPETPYPPPHDWRRLYVGGMAAFFKAWDLGGRRIVPGIPSPANVAVPDVDFREEGVLRSLAGWVPYAGPASMVGPLVANFYRKPAAHFPWIRGQIDLAWIFDACYEALGYAAASEFFAALRADPALVPLSGPGGAPVAAALDEYLVDFEKNVMIPLPAMSAIGRYKDWEIRAAAPSPEERERKTLEVFALYRLDRYPSVARYYLYRHAYFAGVPERALAAFDKLIARMQERPDVPAVQLVELSELQAAIDRDDDRAVFGRLAFPGLGPGRRLEITEFGDTGAKKVIVRSTITGRRGGTFAFRETYDPAEIGQLYRLFFKESYPKAISEQDRHYILQDAAERLVGGLCHRMMFESAAFIDGIVVASPLQRAGLASGMIEDFCGRMAAAGVSVVLTHFYLPDLFLRSGIKVDTRWGAMVRYV